VLISLAGCDLNSTPPINITPEKISNIINCIYIHNEPRYSFEFWEMYGEKRILSFKYAFIILDKRDKALEDFEFIAFLLSRLIFSFLSSYKTSIVRKKV
jgi:hypothetical protein